MPDYTSEIAELSAAYQANRVANATISHEVRNKYRAIIAAEIDERKRETDKKFADHLAAVKSRANLPVGIIQDHVLHTKAWSRWVYWRDLAGLAPEKVSVGLAREAKILEKSHFRWSDDYATVTVVKNSNGDELDEPVIYTADTIRVKNELFYALPTSDRDELVAIKTDTYKGWMTQLHNELEAQIEAGNLTTDLKPGSL